MELTDIIRMTTLSGINADLGQTLLRQHEIIQAQKQKISELEAMVIELTKDNADASGNS